MKISPFLLNKVIRLNKYNKLKIKISKINSIV